MEASVSSPLQRLLRRLNVEAVETDVFVGHPGQGEGALFGGLVAAQAAVAAGRSVPERQLHSLHGYFMRPGRHNLPIRFTVDRLRDGRTFATRQVVAQQAGEPIFTLAASFTRPEEGISHQDTMPDAPPPDGLPDWEDLRAQLLGDPAKRRPDGPIEVRVCDPEPAEAGAPIGRAHLVGAIRREYEKSAKAFPGAPAGVLPA